MKVLLLCGSHPRHLYMAKMLETNCLLQALIVEERAHILPAAPAYLDEETKNLFEYHFKKRETCEEKYFNSLNVEDINVPILKTSKEELNSERTIKFIKQQNAEHLISYGVHILNENVLDAVKGIKLNIHGGLSPWFRGNTTLFWPFYLLRPNWAGMTIHELTNRLDGGRIVHHSLPPLSYGDAMHDTACKAVLKAAQDVVAILTNIKQPDDICYHEQTTSGKIWLSSDWTPYHLQVIYKLYEDKIVDLYLDGKIKAPLPPLITAL